MFQFDLVVTTGQENSSLSSSGKGKGDFKCNITMLLSNHRIIRGK